MKHFWLLAFALALSSGARAAGHTAMEDFGHIALIRDHVAWPSPEEVLRGLRDSDGRKRGEAFDSMGIGSASTGIGTAIPHQVALRFAPLGPRSAQQAILTVDLGEARYGMVYGAVATERTNGWERIAAFSCWCKYERGDLLSKFTEVIRGADGEDELVVRGSGGGTGIVVQDEVHFRVFGDELRAVLHFVSFRRNCNAGSPGHFRCNFESRWFLMAPRETGRAFEVTARGGFDALKASTAEFERRNLELRHTSKLSCRAYRWSREKFVYLPVKTPASNPCQARNSKP